MNRSVKYVNGSFVGFLNGFRATGYLDTKEDVNERLDYLESIFTKYDQRIVTNFFLISRETIESFLMNPDDLIFALDIKQDPSKRKIEFDKMHQENFSFKNYFDFMNLDKSIRF
jgi:hypothetical protein